MAAYEWLLVDLLIFIYNLTWLVFLTRKHYGEVTTTAGHIFELNVLLTSTINNINLIIFVDLEILPLGIMTQIIETADHYSFLMALAGSQIETAVFLKTLNVNTMMTNTAGKIILVMIISSYGLAVIMTLALPSKIVQFSEIYSCTYLTPKSFFRVIIPETVGLVLVLSVMGFGVFRGLQIRRTGVVEESPDNSTSMEIEHETGRKSRVTPPQGRLFTIMEVISELNQGTPREIIEEDLVIEDIEFVDIETSSNSENNLKACAMSEIQPTDTPSQGTMISVKALNNFNQETPREIIEEDLVIEDVEFSDIEISSNSENNIKACALSEIQPTDTPSQGTMISVKALTNFNQETPRQSIVNSTSTMDHAVMIDETNQVQRTNQENNMYVSGMSENQQNPIGCVPGMNMILKTIKKYMKNTMISLLILTTAIPLKLTLVYGFITNSGCENHTVKAMIEMSECGWYLFNTLLPLLIKLKLDRLSE